MPRSRAPAQLSESLHRRLNSYAVAASAAGVSLLAIAPPASAKVVYTPATVTIGPNGSYQLDLNHDGAADFALVDFWCSTSCLNNIHATAAPNNLVAGFRRNIFVTAAYALPNGALIGPKKRFLAKTAYITGSESWGYWRNASNRYLGLKFEIKGQYHYGWARLSTVFINRYTVEAALTGYAYETIPNKAIITGKTKGPDVVTVRDAALGRLARGVVTSPWQVK
jgi:hypothetical protein